MTQEFIDILKSINPMIFEGNYTNLITDCIIDSLDVMNIMIKMEDEYNIEFSAEDLSMENFKSVQSIWNVVQSLKKE